MVPTLLAIVMDLVGLPGLDTTAALELLLQIGLDQGGLEVLVVQGDLEGLEGLHLTAGMAPAIVGVLEDQASILHPLTTTRQVRSDCM